MAAKTILALLACLPWQAASLALRPKYTAPQAAEPVRYCCCPAGRCPCGCDVPEPEGTPGHLEWVVCPCDGASAMIPSSAVPLTVDTSFLAVGSTDLDVPFDGVLSCGPIRLDFHGPPPESLSLSTIVLLN